MAAESMIDHFIVNTKRILPPPAVFFCISAALVTSPHSDADEGDNKTRFSLKLKEVEIRDVLTLLAEESGRNIVVPEGLVQKVSLSLEDITLEDALKVILKSYGLSYVTERGIIRVVGISDSHTKLSNEDLITEIITLNYARAADLEEQVKGVLTFQLLHYKGCERRHR
jgi:type IV pilus assembly protein PilQ